MNFFPNGMIPNMGPINNGFDYMNQIFNKLNEFEGRIKRLEQRINKLENNSNNGNSKEPDNTMYML